MLNRMTILILALLIVFSATVSAEEMPREDTPACEIKLLIDSGQALDGNQLLAESIQDQFQTGNKYKSFGVTYLDTPDRDYLNAGWINRIRMKDGKSKYTLTYKKRYPVENNDIDAALKKASEDGFSLSDPDFSAEIDWGYTKMTLSFSRDVTVKSAELPDIDHLGTNDAAGMIDEHMPSLEKNWKEDSETADPVQIAGPIHFLRYSGTFDGQDIQFEIWPVPAGDDIENIVELSVKCESPEAAAEIRGSIVEALDEMGILLHSDTLKTQMILGAFNGA